MKQDRIASAQRPDAAQQIRGREAAHRHRRRGLARDSRGQLDQRRRGNHRSVLYAPSVLTNPCTSRGRPARRWSRLADRLDDAARFDADAVRQRNRIEPARK
jgi:hypothetical protein